jgi:hypothetical protein
MVKHIVFFKLEDNSYENKETIRYMILNLKDKISVIKGFEVGINFSQEQRAYDLALVSDFENEEDLQVYATHPLHVEVVEYLKSKNTTTKVVDYRY